MSASPAQQQQHRCFIAVPVKTPVALSLLARRDSLLDDLNAASPSAVPAANFHMTLLFLGSVPGASLAPLADAMVSVARQFAAFSQPLERIALFPDREGRILAAQGKASPMLQRLVDSLASVVKSTDEPRAGVTELGGGRLFRPHITLARLQRRPTVAVDVALDLLLDVDRMALFESVWRQGRPVYRLLRGEDLASGSNRENWSE